MSSQNYFWLPVEEKIRYLAKLICDKVTTRPVQQTDLKLTLGQARNSFSLPNQNVTVTIRVHLELK